MLSYQHAYHAGNPVDVAKHTVLAHVLAHQIQKPAPVIYLETHAGRGVYPLDGAEMQKTAEYRDGAHKMWQTGPASHIYRQLLKKWNKGPELALIPGSPAVAHSMLRPTDTLHLFEKHPGEYTHLQNNTQNWPNTHIHATSGPEGALALTKPGSRTVILIDPSYEQKAEYAQTAQSIATILAKWPRAVIMVWYPILKGAPHNALVNALKQLHVSSTWKAELHWPSKAEDGRGLHGTGQIILNMPYRLEETLIPSLHEVSSILGLSQPLAHFEVAPR